MVDGSYPSGTGIAKASGGVSPQSTRRTLEPNHGRSRQVRRNLSERGAVKKLENGVSREQTIEPNE